MPLFRIKKVWDYCTYNKPFFILILIIFTFLNSLEDYFADSSSFLPLTIFFVCMVILFGYGLTITRDRINHGVRLPKVLPKDILFLGFKSVIVLSVYVLVQGFILDTICRPLGFPAFDLEDMLFQFWDTIRSLYTHNPADSLIFLTVGAVIFYITLFFMEIALARLADTGKLSSSFNLISIKRIIDVIGWRAYTVECTMIIVAMVILGVAKLFYIPFPYLDFIVDTVLDLLVFVIQFLGIGAVYSKYKDKQLENQK